MDVKNYEELISKVSQEIAEKFLSLEENLPQRALFVDADISALTRHIGLETTKRVYEKVLKQQVKQKKNEGLEIKRSSTIQFHVIFGTMELNSPYLWTKGQHSKPLIDEMGIRHHGRSEAVNRALRDFGSEEAFGQAATRFKEHYHYALSSSTGSRVTKQVAQEAQTYVEQTLAAARENAEEVGDKARARVETLLVELDGCDIRTAQLLPVANTTETSPVRQFPKKVKQINWREVRIGLARSLESMDKIYIGKMASYPEVVGQLVDAARLVGMSSGTQVVGVADGGNGLKEEVEQQFDTLQFILDKKHVKDHLYETAEALGIARKDRPGWVKAHVETIRSGEVAQFISELEEIYTTTQNHRVKRLIGYLHRFADALNYHKFKERGYPVGSGEIESAHKSVPQKRLKLPGACWHPDSINPMLALRILRAHEWWEDFWHKRAEDILAAA
jgi:hypothetical protein